MPIYEYQCQSCGHKLEALQKLADAPLTDCPACENPALKKLVTAAAFKLKGTGWYETDFKNSGKKQEKPASAEGGAKEGGSKEAGSKSAESAKSAKTASKSSGGSSGASV